MMEITSGGEWGGGETSFSKLNYMLEDLEEEDNVLVGAC